MAVVNVTTNDGAGMSSLSTEGWDLSQDVARTEFSRRIMNAVDSAEVVERTDENPEMEEP